MAKLLPSMIVVLGLVSGCVTPRERYDEPAYAQPAYCDPGQEQCACTPDRPCPYGYGPGAYGPPAGAYGRGDRDDHDEDGYREHRGDHRHDDGDRGRPRDDEGQDHHENQDHHEDHEGRD